MTREITSNDDIIDSRDVIARIEELESDLEAERERLSIAIALPDHENTIQGHRDQIEDLKNELAPLRALAGQGDYIEDWQYGATLIRDSYFEEYARELAEELDLIPTNATWPATCIDWEQAARELQMDYTSVEFDGITYWVR